MMVAGHMARADGSRGDDGDRSAGARGEPVAALASLSETMAVTVSVWLSPASPVKLPVNEQV